MSDMSFRYFKSAAEFVIGDRLLPYFCVVSRSHSCACGFSSQSDRDPGPCISGLGPCTWRVARAWLQKTFTECGVSCGAGGGLVSCGAGVMVGACSPRAVCSIWKCGLRKGCGVGN